MPEPERCWNIEKPWLRVRMDARLGQRIGQGKWHSSDCRR